MSGDKPLAGQDSAASEGQKTLVEAAYEFMKEGYERLKSATSPTDTVSAQQQLEKQGTLPQMQLEGQKVEATPAKKGDAAAPAHDSKADKGPKDVLANAEASHEDKLKAAYELAKDGEKSFIGPDGRKYEISLKEVGRRTLVSVHTDDGDGKSHAVLRGVKHEDGHISRQRDTEGKEVSYASLWASRNLEDSPLVKGQETSEKAADKSEGKTETAAEKAPTAEEFLKNHPEVKLSAWEEAKLNKELEKAKKDLEKDKAHLDDLSKANAKLNDVVRDLKKDGITELEDPGKFKEEFAKLPADKQAAYQKRFDEISAYAKDLQRLPEIQAKVKLEEKKVRDLTSALDFDDDLKAIDKLPPDERKEVYASLEKILDRGDKTQTTLLSTSERTQITRDLVHQIAHPEDIKQGNKDTCALASSEYVLAKDHPDVYARSVAELATKAELTTFGDKQVATGSGVKINPESIYKEDGNPERTLASKIFQTGAANLALADKGARYENYKPGEAPPLTSGKTPVDDTGERYIDKDGKVYEWPGLYAQDQVNVLNKLTGDNYRADKLYASDPAELHRMLDKEAKEHGYPIKVSFLLNDGSGHAVTITGIDTTKTPAEVVYEDPAEPRGTPQRMKIDTFYQTALKGGSIETTGFGKVMILATGDIRPYVEIIHN